jgi:hypothetical protein
MSRGWLVFRFWVEVDTELILKGKRFWGKTFLTLKPWHSCFNPRREVAGSIPVWEKIQELPLELWCNKFLWDLGNFLGKKIMVDTSCKTSSFHSVARVLVELYLKGLAENIDIELHNEFTQPLDYTNLPFRCMQCHIYGHGIAYCLKPFIKKVWRKKQTDPEPPKPKNSDSAAVTE